MHKLTGYIFRQILMLSLFTAFVLCATVVMGQSVRLVDMIVNNGLSFANFAWIVLLTVPKLLSYILPITCFIGLLITYRRLSAEHELTVMKAMGFSDFKLQYPGFLAAFLVMLCCYGLNLLLTPLSMQNLRQTLHTHQSQWSLALIKEGEFTNIGNTITLYVRSREGNRLSGIMYDSQMANDQFTIFAKYGQIVEEGGKPRILVFDGVRQSLNMDAILQFVSFEQTILEISGDSPLRLNQQKPPSERFLVDLFNHSEADIARPKFVGELLSHAHAMLSQPLMVLGLVAIAFAVLFSMPYRRGSSVIPILLASLLALCAMMGHYGIGILAVSWPMLNIGQYAVPVMLIIIGSGFSMRVKHWRKWKNHLEAVDMIKPNMGQA